MMASLSASLSPSVCVFESRRRGLSPTFTAPSRVDVSATPEGVLSLSLRVCERLTLRAAAEEGTAEGVFAEGAGGAGAAAAALSLCCSREALVGRSTGRARSCSAMCRGVVSRLFCCEGTTMRPPVRFLGAVAALLSSFSALACTLASAFASAGEDFTSALASFSGVCVSLDWERERETERDCEREADSECEANAGERGTQFAWYTLSLTGTDTELDPLTGMQKGTLAALHTEGVFEEVAEEVPVPLRLTITGVGLPIDEFAAPALA